jgi:hypothetical protein
MDILGKYTESLNSALSSCDEHARELRHMVLTGETPETMINNLRDSILRYHSITKATLALPDESNEELMKKCMIVTRVYGPMFGKHHDMVDQVANLLRDETLDPIKKINRIKNAMM